MPEWKALVRARLGRLPVDAAREMDIVDELAQHVAEHHKELTANGVDAERAIELALAPLAKRAAQEIARADRPRVSTPPPPTGGSILGAFARDVRYALRLLRHAPSFAAAATITLALGIGANVAIFSVVRAVILRPPAYRDPSSVIAFVNSRPGGGPGSITSSSLPDYEDWQRQLTSFDSMGLMSGWTFNLSGLDLPERIFGARVSGSLFGVLGATPLFGRTIEPSDDRPSGDEVVVLGYRVWQRLFAGDRTVLGRRLMMEGRPHIVIGVMPPRFRFPTDDVELWAAIKDNMSGMPRSGRFMTAVGRLKRGVPLAAAQAELDAVTAQLDTAYPDSNHGWHVRLLPAHTAIVGDTRPALLLLAGAVGLVLLIACANVSNLLFARATARRRETAIRLALGASRARMVAQWLTENMVLSLLGGTLGLALAFGAVRLVVAFGPRDVPRLDETSVDAAVLAFTFLLALAAGALPALAPAIRALRASQAALKDGIGGYSGGSAGRGGAVLIVAEVALAMTLAVGAALLFKSFARLTSVPPGFDSSNMITFKVFLGPPRYRTAADAKQYIRTAIDRVASLPGIDSVGAVSQLPLSDPASGQLFDIEGQTPVPGNRPMAGYRAVSTNYFDLLKIPIVRGRPFTDQDREDAPPVIIVNEAAARRFWPNQDPIGQRIHWATAIPVFDAAVHTVVGVAADVKSNGLDKPEAPAVYAPYLQRKFTWLRWNTFVARTKGEPVAYARTIREFLTNVDPLQPVYQMQSMDEVIADSVAVRRFNTGLLDLFAALGLALCAVGVYGTINYWVTERAREIGMRMALGASRRGITRMVVGRALVLTALGVAIGLAVSVAAGRALTTFLFAVQPSDPATIAIVSLLVLGTGAVAAYVPARRAARLDPLSVIRSE
jgi:putative ABC transport system permease protein